jgi:hypothetical protein
MEKGISRLERGGGFDTKLLGLVSNVVIILITLSYKVHALHFYAILSP